MATEVGNIHIGLYVDVGESRRFTDVANVVEQSSRRMNTSLGHTSTAVRALRGQMSQSMQFRIAQNSLRDLTRATDATTQLRAAIVGLSSVATGSLTGAFSAAYLVQMADKARLLSNQIKTVTNGTAEFGAVQDSLFEVSQRTRSSYESTTTLYSRMARATDHFRMSQDKLLRVTETVQKAFAIGGASPQEAQGGAIQLSQGIASNRLGGEEFRSVAENAPVLLKGIADALGVNIGKLREMAHAGELTSQVVTEAILKASDKIDAAFGKMTPTVAQSWTLLNNAILRYTGASDEAYGVTEKIASAIAGLAANLEDVMYWVTRVAGGLGALYAARKLTTSAQGMIGGARANTAAAKEQVAGFEDNGQAIRNRLAEINTEIADANKKVAQAEDAALAKHGDAVNAAKEKEFKAQQQINGLEGQRANLLKKIADARATALAKLQSEVDLARQRVKDDLVRVNQAKEAAAAEERLLRAKQAQKLTQAGQAVTKAEEGVFSTLGRVGETEKTIRAEKELAKTRITGEIDARRQSLVTGTMRLRAVQDQIAELRSINDLAGFEESYGKQYRGLLADQQKAIISTGNLRKEITSLEQKMSDIDSGAATTKGITSAMTQHAAAVRRAEIAVQSLSKAEDARAKIAGGSIGGKSVEARIAAQTKEIARHEKSVANLVTKMIDLRAATEGAFTGGAASKMLKDFDALDRKIIAAQNELKAASQAVGAVQGGNAQMLEASLAAQQKAAQQVNALQKEAANLIDAQVLNTGKLEAAQKRVNILRRAGSGFVGAFGGPWGLGITVALVAATALMAKFAANAAESAQQTEKITKQLRDMGYLTEEAANAMDGFAGSIAGKQISKLQVELTNFQADLKKTIGQLNDLDLPDQITDQVAKSQPKLVIPPGSTSDEVRRLRQQFIDASQVASAPLIGSLQKIRDEMIKNKGMSEEMRKSLEDMALANPALSSTTLQLITFGERMNAIGKAVNDWVDSLKKLREEANKLPQERFWNTRTEAAQNQQKIEAAKNAVVTTMVDEANLNESEKRIKAIMDEIVKSMDKAGQTLNSAAVRADAEKIYAGEQATKAIGGFTDRIIQGESGGKGNARPLNADGTRRSSAYGLGQFIESTWLTLFKKYFPREAASMTEAQILELRSDTEKSRALIDAYARENADILQKAGVSVNEVALQLAHFLGPQGAVAVLKAAPGTLAKDVLSASAVKANPEILGGNATVDDVIAYGQKRAGLNTSGTQKIDARESFANALGEQQRLIDGLLAEAGIRKDLNPLVNDYGRAVSTLEAAQKLLNTAQEEGTAAGTELKNVQQLLKGDFTNLTPEARAQAEAMLALAQKTGEATAAGVQMEENQKQVKERLSESAALGKSVFSGMISDMRSGVSASEMLANALNRILDKLIDISLNSLFDGPIAGSGGGPLGGMFSGLLGSFGGGAFPSAPVGLFDDGGFTGPGHKKKAAGVVHAGEFVFDAESTKKAGVENLYRMMEMLKGGMPGFEYGGYVGAARIPSMPSTASMMSSAGFLASGESASGDKSSTVMIILDDNLKAEILKEAAGQSIQIVGASAPSIVEKSTASAGSALGKGKFDGGMAKYGLKRKANVG